MNTFSLSKKALLSFLVILLPIFFTFMYSYNRNREYLKEKILDDMTVIAEAYEGGVYQFLEMNKRRVEDFSTDGFIRDRLMEIARGNRPAAARLNEHLIRNKIVLDRTIRKIHVIGLDGRVLASTEGASIGKNVSKENYFVKGLSGPSISEDYLGEKGRPELAVSAPVLRTDDSKRPVGVITNFILLSELNKLMTGEFNRELGAISWKRGRMRTMETYIVNKDRLMITESIFIPDAVLQVVADTLPVEKCLGETGEVAGFYRDYRGVPVAGASMCIPSMKWTLLVETDEEEVITPLNTLLGSAAVTALVVSGLIAGLYILFIRYVVRPVSSLSGAAREIAGGNYGISVPVETSDEIGVLSASFNAMAGEIRERTREIEEERNRAQMYLGVAGVVILALDREGRIVLLNRKGCEVIGCSSKDVIGLNWFDNFIPQGTREVLRERFGRLLSGKPFEYYEHPIITKGGKERVFAWYNTTVAGKDGSVSGTLSSGEDITERRMAEEALRESEEKFRTLFEEIMDAVIINTPDDRFLDINPAGVEMLGYDSKEEILKADIKGFYVNPEDRERYKKELEEKGFIKDFEAALRKKNGELITVSISSTAVRDEAGRIAAYRCVARDVTDHKKLEAQLLQAQKMEAIGQLTGGIAHDFNNILTAIIGYGSVLKMKMREDNPLRAHVDGLLRSAESAAALTHGLLAFGRKQIITLKPMKLNVIVTGVTRLVSRLIGEDIRFRTVLTADDPVVTADGGQIEQVLMNLATNAMDAMPGGGVLTVKTEVVRLESGFVQAHGYGNPGDYALMTVSDTGTGMDKKTLQKIFEPFFTTKEVGKGTGLGLSIVYGVIKQHNGYINVYSEPGAGTTFRIYLPLSAEALEEKALQGDEAPIGGSETILIAEDSEEVRNLTKSILEEFGYTVITAVDGEEAVERFMENRDRIGLLLFDVIMPRKNGKEAYDEIRKTAADVKAIFLSGYTEEIIQKKGLFEEGLSLVSKPIAPTLLLKKIRETLDIDKG